MESIQFLLKILEYEGVIGEEHFHETVSATP